MKDKRFWSGMCVKFRRVMIGFEKRDMEDRVKMREIGREIKLIYERRDLVVNRKGA